MILPPWNHHHITSDIDTSPKRPDARIFSDPFPRTALDSDFTSDISSDNESDEIKEKFNNPIDPGKWMTNKYASWQGHQVLPSNFVSFNNPAHSQPLGSQTYRPAVSAANLRALYPELRFPPAFWKPGPYAHLALENMTPEQAAMIPGNTPRDFLPATDRNLERNVQDDSRQDKTVMAIPGARTPRKYKFIPSRYNQDDMQLPAQTTPSGSRSSVAHLLQPAAHSDSRNYPLHSNIPVQEEIAVGDMQPPFPYSSPDTSALKRHQKIDLRSPSRPTDNGKMKNPLGFFSNAPPLRPIPAGILDPPRCSIFPNLRILPRPTPMMETASYAPYSIPPVNYTNSATFSSSIEQRSRCLGSTSDEKITLYTTKPVENIRQVLAVESIPHRALAFMRTLTGVAIPVDHEYWRMEKGIRLLRAVENWEERVEIKAVILGDGEIVNMVTF